LIALRARAFDLAAERYVSSHPDATVVALAEDLTDQFPAARRQSARQPIPLAHSRSAPHRRVSPLASARIAEGVVVRPVRVRLFDPLRPALTLL
jgi:hypothetical protein